MAQKQKRKRSPKPHSPMTATTFLLTEAQREKLQQLQVDLCQPNQGSVIRLLIDCAQPANLSPVVFTTIGGER